MGSLNLPMPSDIPTLSLSDSVGKWAGIENQQRQADLSAIQEKRLGQQAEQEGKVNEIKFNALQRAAHNEILTAFKTELQKKAQMAGIQPNTPEYQKLANATYAGRYDKLMQNTGIPAFQPGTDIDLAHVQTVMTPDEEHARIMEQEQAKQKAMFYREKMLLDYGNQYKDKADERNHQQSLDLVDRKHGYDTGDMLLEHKLKIAELESKAENTPPKLDNVPPAHRMAYIGNQESLRKIDDAIKLIEGNKKALGAQNMLSEALNQRIDKEGVPVRAAIAEIGGTKLHDLSGAAVSASEAPRLMPLIPVATDTADAAIAKLKNLRKEYAGINGQLEQMYNTGEYKNPMVSQQPQDHPQKTTYNLSTATQKKPDNVSPEKWQKYLESIGAK